MKQILLAYDGSEPARRAARQAADLAVRYGGRVTVGLVGGLLESGYGTQVPVVDVEECERALAEGVERVRREGASTEGRLVWGQAGPELVRLAAETGADLIVTGHRGRGGLESLLLGSVAKHVIDHATCSVLVVR